jgi:adenylate cyclase
LVNGGTLIRRDNRWLCTAGCEAVDIPPTLHGLLLSRVDRLRGDARRLLQGAAVFGEAFDEPMLQAVTKDVAGGGNAIDVLLDAGLIEREGNGPRYRFTHVLIHEVVYQNLLLSRRSELHERAARAIEEATAPVPRRLSDMEALGHHWSLSPDKAKGARYLEAAGDWARAVYANDDAIRHYRRALRTLADCPDCDDQARGVREKLADVLALVGQWTDALGHYEALRRELEAADENVGLARLYRKIGVLRWETGDRERAGASFASGLERIGEDGSSIERAQLLQELGRLAFRAGDNAGAIAWAEQALLQAAKGDGSSDAERSREAAATRAQAYNTLGVALARTGRLTDAADKIEQSIAMAQRHDLLQVACRGYANLGVLYSALDPRRSIETCLRGLEVAKRIGDLGFQSRLYANLAVAYCALTDRCEMEGLEAAQMSIELDRRLGLLDHLAVPLIVVGQIYQCRGEYAPAFKAFCEALGLAERAGEPQLLFPCYDGLATLHLDAGNEALAELYLAKSKAMCEQARLQPDGLIMLPFLS